MVGIPANVPSSRNAVFPERVAVLALGAGLIGVDFMTEVHRLRPAAIDGVWKAGPARAQGDGQSSQKRDFSA
jgi:hypothetical protein